MEDRELDVPTSCTYPIQIINHEKLHALPVPLARITTCGPIKIEVLKEVMSTDPPLGRYEIISPQTLRGRGVVSSLSFLKVLAGRPHRMATYDWLTTQMRQELPRGAEIRLDSFASYLRGILCQLKTEQAMIDPLRLLLVECLRNGRSSGSSYQLAAYPLLWLDTEALAYQVEHGILMENMGEPALALPFWRRAYQLASRGEYLPDNPHSDWAQHMREQVEGYLRQSVYALRRLLLAERGEVAKEEVLLLLRTYWLSHKTDEDVLRPLMELLGEQERFGEARGYYLQCVATLKQFGREPAKQTNDLYEFQCIKQLQRKPKLASTTLFQEIHSNVPNSSVPSQTPMVQLYYTPLVAFPNQGMDQNRHMSSELGICVPDSLSMYNPSLEEETFGDCAAWFGEKLAHIIAFITQWKNQMDFINFQKLLDRELRVFDEVKAIFDSDSYFLSRRVALLAIAALPGNLLGLQQRPKTMFDEKEALPACTVSITACWHLLNGREFTSVEHTLSRLMPFLLMWAQQTSTYQKSVASLASQGCLLLSLIASHRLQLQQRVVYCKEAITYAKEAEDRTLQVKALTMLGNALYDQEKYKGMLRAYQEARYIVNQAPHAIPHVLQCKVAMGLAHAYAQHAQAKEALDAITEARDIFPGETEELPAFLSADDGLFSLILFEGWIRLDLGRLDPKRAHFEQAAQALAQVEKLPKTTLVPERIRVEICNRRAQAALELGNLSAFCHYTLQGAEGLKVVQSKKRRLEIVTNYKKARKKWSHETQVQELVDVLL